MVFIFEYPTLKGFESKEDLCVGIFKLKGFESKKDLQAYSNPINVILSIWETSKSLMTTSEYINKIWMDFWLRWVLFI